MANPRNILAGQKAGGAQGLSLVWARNFVDYTSLPQLSSTTVDTSTFTDMGNCDQKGVDLKSNVSKTDIKSFGSIYPQGTLFTDMSGSLDVTFQETTPDVVAMFRSQPLGSITPDSNGSFGVSVSMPQDIRYQLVVVSFSQHGDPIRFILPNVANTTPGDFNLQMGQVLDRPITFTLYPDDKGNLFYEQYLRTGATSSVAQTQATAEWAANTAYPAGTDVAVGGITLQASVGGTSGASAPTPPANAGDTVVDGSVTWVKLGA